MEKRGIIHPDVTPDIDNKMKKFDSKKNRNRLTKSASGDVLKEQINILSNDETQRIIDRSDIIKK